MAVNRPYYRIYRPSVRRNAFDNSTEGYDHDNLFLPEVERRSMIMAARLIIDDFERLFEYIEPHTNHENVFSHRIYELLLRTCTEVESCCKGILTANGHGANNMDDYRKIEQATHLSHYIIHYTNWFPSVYICQPFAGWAAENPLPWYRAYNDVKHNRRQSFHLASIKNLLDAIGGLLCIIHAQIGNDVQMAFASNIYIQADGVEEVNVRSFKIEPYHVPEAERYDFVWNNLITDPNRFQRFLFV